jgi:predicted CXXCH cytochrome family protein
VTRGFIIAGVLSLMLTSASLGQNIGGDVMGVHDLSPGGPSPVQGPRPGSCTYCHVPHSGNGNMAPLWNQKLSTSAYTPYTSTTYKQQANAQMPLGSDSGLCLSCHDGTIAPGDTVLFGTLNMQGQMYDPDKFGTILLNSHPFSLVLPIKDDIDLVATLVQGKTADPTGSIKLIGGNVECTSCHSPHVQAIDKLSMNFLVRDSSGGTMCLACHDPDRTAVSGTNTPNPMAGWKISVHGVATNKVSGTAKLGTYGTVAANACLSCHAPHNAAGPARIVRGLNEQACMGCHAGGNNVSPAVANIFAEVAKVGHPLPNPTNAHDATEPAVLNNNRHATCVDCHNSHGSQQVTSFNPPPLMRVSQAGTGGIAMDGVTVLALASNQYETCLRCHGLSAGKVANPIYGYLPARASADPLNLIPQMNTSAKSSHPVMHIRSSPSPQPSLLLTMLDFNGTKTNGRDMGTQIFCTDCHNSDDNREFGLGGPNGPHGSKWLHILERQYLSSQAPGGPGTTITVNINQGPDLTVNGPYGMCAKCHDLKNVMSNVSWSEHKRHVSDDGFSCSVCHNPHGMTAITANPTGVGMVDFDLNVVGKNGISAISFNQGTNTCTLQCHNHVH